MKNIHLFTPAVDLDTLDSLDIYSPLLWTWTLDTLDIYSPLLWTWPLDTLDSEGEKFIFASSLASVNLKITKYF